MDIGNETADDVIYEVDDGTGPGGEGLRHLIDTTVPLNPHQHICTILPGANPRAAGRFQGAGTRELPQFIGYGWRIRFFKTGYLDTGEDIATVAGQDGNACRRLRKVDGEYRILPC